MNFKNTPLKFVTKINERTLGEDTDPEREIQYADLSAVNLVSGEVSPRRETFGSAPGRARRIVVNGDSLVPYLTGGPGWSSVRPLWIGSGDLAGVIFSTGFYSITSREKIVPRFLYYAISSRKILDELKQLSTGVTLEGFTAEALGRCGVPLPTAEVQKTISDYLDREVACIDALITKKQRMIELLEMRFVGESTAYVLSGTRNTQTVQSRTGFYGLVPTGWKETSLRHLGCEVQTGPFGSQLHAEEYVENGWPVVNPQNLKEGRILPIADMCVSSEKRQDLGRHILRFGDIVFGRRGEMGRAGLVSEVEAGWLCGTGSLRLRLMSKEIVPEYFLLLLQTQAAKAYFQLSSVGSTMENLNSEILLDFPMLVPSVTEQSEIITRMAELRTKKDRMNTLVKEQVRLLSERRQALITAAVTGEFGIPEVAA